MIEGYFYNCISCDKVLYLLYDNVLEWVVIIFSKLKQQFSFIDIFLFVSVILIGGFNEFAGCILSIILTIYIFLKLKNNKQLTIKLNPLSISISLICLMYAVSILWAVDSGMAFIGFLKFLPLVLFLVAIWQTKQINFETLLPYFSAVTVILSVICMLIPFTAHYFSVADRLAGFFQYPNTFALFLLVSELVLLGKEKFKLIDFICLCVLIFGILYTGSRTVFLIAIVSNAAMIIYKFRKALSKKYVLIGIGCAVLVCAAIVIINPRGILDRYLSISLTESTFVGRILYWVDALPLLLKYPFGMGYLGYNFIQGTIQTGWYNVRYAHNDFLQLALDVGIIPLAVFVFAIIKSLVKKGIPFYKRVSILSICAHSFFDFDLQFLAMFFLTILLLSHSDGKIITLKKQRNILGCVLATLLIVNVYMAVHLSLAFFEQNIAADKLYPFNTDVKISMLETEKDLSQANSIADEILKQNTASYIPYSIKAKYYYSVGDFNMMIQSKRTVFEHNPFEYKEYEEYCQMLINGISLYQKMGDNQSVQFCQQELVNTKETLEKNINSLSELGKKIDDIPSSELPEEILFYISKIEKE